MEVYIDEYMDNEVCKLFALTGKTATWGILAIPQEKQKKKQVTTESVIKSNTFCSTFVPIKSLKIIKNIKYQ